MEEPVRISAVEPVARSFRAVSAILFSNFTAGKWFVMGFCAFLAQLGQGARFNFNTSFPGPGDFGGQEQEDIKNWFFQYQELIIIMGVLVVLLGLALAVLFIWLSSRGQFMFLENVLSNRAAVVEPWHRFRAQANSLFRMRVVLIVLGTLGSVLTLGLCAAIAYPDIKAWELSTSGVVAIVLAVLVMLLVWLTYALLESASRAG